MENLYYFSKLKMRFPTLRIEWRNILNASQLDRLKDGAAPGLSYSVVMEHNIEEPAFVNDAGVNVSDMSLCALDTYDSLQGIPNLG